MPLMMNRCVGTVAVMGGVPAVYPAFVNSYKNLILWNAQYLCHPGEYVHYPDPPTASIHDLARNGLVDGMRGDWLLMIDSDHQFAPDLLYRLLVLADRTDAQVAVGFYQYKGEPHIPVVYVEREGRLLPLCGWDKDIYAVEVAAAGAGCLWVRREVFDRVRDELGEKPFDRVGGNGEDISFFLRLKKLGVKAVCSPRIECHHLETRPVSLADYDPSVLELHDPEPLAGYKS